MGDRTHKDKNQETLVACARERIEQGLLPRVKAARSWGGRGSGLPCSLCDSPILETEPEMELEFDGAASARALRFHLGCQSAWEVARRVRTEGDWTPVEEELPPYDTVVEARVIMGAARSVILGVTRVRCRAHDDSWLNVTTHAPLPDSWRPVEWRYPANTEHAADRNSAGTTAPKRA